jgi:hypothetical protein
LSYLGKENNFSCYLAFQKLRKTLTNHLKVKVNPEDPSVPFIQKLIKILSEMELYVR